MIGAGVRADRQARAQRSARARVTDHVERTVGRPIGRPFLRAAGLTLALGGIVAGRALAVRLGADGVIAGVAFAGGLLVIARIGGQRPSIPRPRQIAAGLALAVGLVALALLARAHGPALPLGRAAPFAPWALATIAVALGEEAALRGALFAALDESAGPVAALAATSIAFALLHVPLDGTAVLPLDLAVGLALGGLRLATGSIAPSAAAHAAADLAAWFL